MADALRHAWGGLQFYIAKPENLNLNGGPAAELFAELRDHAASIIGWIAASRSATIADDLVTLMQDFWGGNRHYFHKSLDLTQRDLEIERRLSAREPIHRLCREYNVSTQRLYSIARAVRAARVAREASSASHHSRSSG